MEERKSSSDGRSDGEIAAATATPKQPPSRRGSIKLVRSNIPLSIGEEAAISFTTPAHLLSSYHESVAQSDRSFRLAALCGLLAWLTLLSAVIRFSPAESFESLDGIERMCTTLATVILAVSNLSRIVPLAYKGGIDAFSGIITASCIIQFIAMTTNAIMLFFPTPVLIDPFTQGRVHLMRWAEWAPLAATMTFLTEGVDVPHPVYGMKVAGVHGLCQGLSTLTGLVFPFVTSRAVWLALLVNSIVLFCILYVRMWQKYHALAGTDRGRCADEIELYERARLSLKLMATCAFVWTWLILLYFVGWIGPLCYPTHPILGSAELPMVTQTFCELWSKVLYLLIIVDVHDAVFDESSRAERRLQELRSMMSAVWDSSSDVIAISVKSHRTGGVTTMVSPTFVRLERAMTGKLNKECETSFPAFVGAGKGAKGQSCDSKGDGKALVFGLDATDLRKSVRRSSSFQALAGLDTVRPASNTYDGPRVEPKRVHYVQLSGIPTQSGVQKASAMYRPEISEEKPRPGVVAMSELLVRAWQTTGMEVLMMHDIVRTDDVTGESRDVRCEAKVTRLEPNAVLVVVRDISERFRRFEAEKKFVSEATARRKDAEANRFTRHEVKNGLLAAIGLCDSLREAFGDDCGSEVQQVLPNESGAENALAKPQQDGGAADRRSAAAAELLASASKAWQRKLHDSAGHMVDFDVRRCMTELDSTLREVLDTILAQSMARDVMHEVYEPKVERVDMRTVLYGVRGATSQQNERFPLVTRPSPLPPFRFDPQLLRFIHRNAVSNACKYGERGGTIMTEINFNEEESELLMNVINLPGEHHDALVEMGTEAETAVFEPGKRLHPDLSSAESSAEAFDPIQQMKHSSGDGAWIMKKCANTMGGACSIQFEKHRTVFSLRCPAKAIAVSRKAGDDLSEFQLPSNTWGIAIDDSKIQRKLLMRFLGLVGIDRSRSIVLGEDTDEIMAFVDQVVEIIQQNPNDPVLVIADENLDVEDEKGHSTVSGSRCVQRIREALAPKEEKRMLALVRSANDSSEDIAIYNSRAHGFLLKAPIKKDGVMETIAPWWIKRFKGSAAIPSSDRRGADYSSDDFGEIEVSSADIVQTLGVIDALCRHRDPSSVAERWPVIWEKLHVLKGDMKTLKDSMRVTAVLEAIDRLQGPVCPEDFLERWELIRSLAVSVM